MCWQDSSRLQSRTKFGVASVTYIGTDEGWLYLAVFLDLYSRLVVGWSMSERMTSDLVVDALMMGMGRRGQAINPLIHSDRGSQYASTIKRFAVSSVGVSTEHEPER